MPNFDFDPKGRQAEIDAGFLTQPTEEAKPDVMERGNEMLRMLGEVTSDLAVERDEARQEAAAATAYGEALAYPSLDALDELAQHAPPGDPRLDDALESLANYEGEEVAHEWITGREHQNTVAQIALQAEAMQQAQRIQEQEAASVKATVDQWHAQHPNADRAVMAALVDRAGVVASSPEEAKNILDHAHRSAEGLKDAEATAEINAELFGQIAQDRMFHGEIGSLPSKDDLVAGLLGRSVDVNAILNPPKQVNVVEELMRKSPMDDESKNGWNI